MKLIKSLPFLLVAVATGAMVGERYATLDPEETPMLIPRYYPAASRPLLAKRDGDCAKDSHPCLDIGAPTLCCENTKYCMRNEDTLEPGCCAIGSNCGMTLCNTASYVCNVTTTLPATATLSTGRGSSPVTTTTSSAATLKACCPRRCPNTSQYLCAADMGSGCCAYTAACASDRQCIGAPTPTDGMPTRVTPAATGGDCERPGQTPCPASEGGGCCGALQPCTRVGGAAYCALPTASGITAVPAPGDDDDGGLSDGAKAGVGVGVAAGASLVIGGLALLFIRRRRSGGRRSDASASAAAGPGGGWAGRPPMSDAAWDDMTSDVAGPAGGSGTGTGTGTGSGTAAAAAAGASSRGGLHGLARDYTGPDAVEGPYTEAGGLRADGDGEVHAAGGAGSPTTVRRAQRRSRSGVPAEPQGPNDIVAPVEMDSQSGIVSSDGGGEQRRDSGGGASPVEKDAATDTIDGRFELYGSEVASPYLPAAARIREEEEEEARRPRRDTPPVVSPVSQSSPDLETDEDPYSRIRSGADEKEGL